MNTMKRFGLAALFVVVVAMFASSPAIAQDYATITLENTVNAKDRDYGASGQATLTDVTYVYRYWVQGAFDIYGMDIFAGELTVAYQGLTPGATYRIGPTDWGISRPPAKLTSEDSYYYHFTASATGTGEVTVPVSFVAHYWAWIVNPSGWDGGYWEYIRSQDYAISVDRKRGSKYTRVLEGYFPAPYIPEP